MKLKYVVINTMNQIGTDSVGTVVSCHRSPKAAWTAREKFSHRVERANGKGSYIPTRIARVKNSPYRGGSRSPRPSGRVGGYKSIWALTIGL